MKVIVGQVAVESRTRWLNLSPCKFGVLSDVGYPQGLGNQMEKNGGYCLQRHWRVINSFSLLHTYLLGNVNSFIAVMESCPCTPEA